MPFETTIIDVRTQVGEILKFTIRNILILSCNEFE